MALVTALDFKAAGIAMTLEDLRPTLIYPPQLKKFVKKIDQCYEEVVAQFGGDANQVKEALVESDPKNIRYVFIPGAMTIIKDQIYDDDQRSEIKKLYDQIILITLGENKEKINSRLGETLLEIFLQAKMATDSSVGGMYVDIANAIDETNVDDMFAMLLAEDVNFVELLGAVTKKSKPQVSKKIHAHKLYPAKPEPITLDIEKLAIPRGKPIEDRIRDEDSVRGAFTKLLFTHNMPSSIFYDTVSSGEFSIKGIENRKIVGKGAQFGYGIDSQFGDVVIVMTDGFEIDKPFLYPDVFSGDVSRSDDPFYYHSFGIPASYQKEGESEGKLMEREARAFDFRPKDFNGGGTECIGEEYRPTWCNYQIGLASIIRPVDVKMVMIPRWLVKREGDGSKFAENLVKIFGDRVVIYGPEKMEDHYSYVSRSEPFYAEIQSEKKKPITSSTSRDPTPYGNASNMALSAEAFLEAEKLYMFLLL